MVNSTCVLTIQSDEREDRVCRVHREDVKWPALTLRQAVFASDYFQTMYDCAVLLIKRKSIRMRFNADEIREYRGDFNNPGKESHTAAEVWRREPGAVRKT